MKSLSIVFVILFSISILSSAFAGEKMLTMNISKTTNYGILLAEIHYSEKNLPLALKVERIINEDLIKVVNYFEYVPHDIVHFNIDPYTRLTNGSATTFPTNIINLYNFPASNLDHLIVMEDWLQGLVVHEFMHITHLDQTRDFLEIGRKIFGTIAKVPTGIVPRWFTEGIAVWGESHLINGGRLNNHLFNKELFIQFKKNNFCQTIDCLDEPGAYPNGSLAYWAGGHFIEYLEKTKPKSIKCLVEMNSETIPFFLNNAFRNCLDDTAQNLFSKFRQEFANPEIAESLENKIWGQKISNVFGSDNYQAGYVLDHDHLFKVEIDKRSEALVVYDLKDNVSFKAQYDAPIADVSSMIDFDKENKQLLVSFNDDNTNRFQNKSWKLINPETLLVERVLNFAHDPSYVIPVGADSFLTVSYWQNAWQVENGSNLLHVFPSQYNLSLVKKVGEQLLFKINDSKGASSLVLADFQLKKLQVIYKSEQAYDLPIIAQNFLVIREKEQLKLLEFEKTIQISKLSNSLLAGITFATLNDQRILALENRLTTKVVSMGEAQNNIFKTKSETTKIEVSEFNQSAAPVSSPASEVAEKYPRLDHFIPHYWFLAFGTSDNLPSFGALTSLSDPMDYQVVEATALIYPSVGKVGGNIDYSKKMISVNDLWSISGLLNQDYSKTDFNSSLITSRDIILRTDFAILNKRWTYIPGIFSGSSSTNDFISKRTVNNLGFGNRFIFQALTYDEFFQSLTAIANIQVNSPDVGESYLALHTKAEGIWRLSENLTGAVKGSYSKFFKNDFLRGVIYGGGVTDFTQSRFHEFYGVPYSNAYGNQVLATRVSIDYNVWNIYRGKNFIPFFFKEAHILLGRESLYADRIFLDGAILKEQMINALFVGPRLKMNLFYMVPANIDLIFSSIATPNNKNVEQVNFTLTADFF